MDARLNLKWLISIVPRGRGNAVAQICNENHIAVQLLAQARGDGGVIFQKQFVGAAGDNPVPCDGDLHRDLSFL